MRIFLTGASDFIGSAVLRDLQQARHHVVALARSDGAATALIAQGAEVHRGSLEDAPGLAAACISCDGVVHLAFGHDFSKFQENIDVNNRAVQAMAEALRGSNKSLVIASGTLLAACQTQGSRMKDTACSFR
jgi:nucleoside-diphosphate-sugar epimerase